MRRRFTPAVLDAIATAVRAAEQEHRGEIRVVVEAALDVWSILDGTTPRARALEVFARHRVWDTDENNGVLIYVLLADRDVEIVADRGYGGRVTAAQWEAVCRAIEAEFRAGHWQQGLVAGVAAAGRIVRTHFPLTAGHADRNELPDRPALL
jgi:uncharacterized membrane protein